MVLHRTGSLALNSLIQLHNKAYKNDFHTSLYIWCIMQVILQHNFTHHRNHKIGPIDTYRYGWLRNINTATSLYASRNVASDHGSVLRNVALIFFLPSPRIICRREKATWKLVRSLKAWNLCAVTLSSLYLGTRISKVCFWQSIIAISSVPSVQLCLQRFLNLIWSGLRAAFTGTGIWCSGSITPRWQISKNWPSLATSG